MGRAPRCPILRKVSTPRPALSAELWFNGLMTATGGCSSEAHPPTDSRHERLSSGATPNMVIRRFALIATTDKTSTRAWERRCRNVLTLRVIG